MYTAENIIKLCTRPDAAKEEKQINMWAPYSEKYISLFPETLPKLDNIDELDIDIEIHLNEKITIEYAIYNSETLIDEYKIGVSATLDDCQRLLSRIITEYQEFEIADDLDFPLYGDKLNFLVNNHGGYQGIMLQNRINFWNNF